MADKDKDQGKDKKSDSKLKQYLGYLAKPAAVGVALSVIMSATAFFYYLRRDSEDAQHGLFKVINDIDKKSFDYRLLMRGARPAADEVAVLAVDDRSLDIVGRWPWPRDVLGHAIDNAFKNGAKIIASDIVWSEPSFRPEKKFVEKLETTIDLPAAIKQRFDENLDVTDPDKIFSQYIEKNKSKFIIGNFFSKFEETSRSPVGRGYLTSCLDLAFKKHQLTSLVDAQAIPFVVLDKEVLMPDEFATAYTAHLDEVEEGVKAQLPPPKNPQDWYNLNYNIAQAKTEFCEQNFLDPEHDEIAQGLRENWAEIRKQVTGISFNSFDEWATDFRARNLVNNVPLTLDWTLTIPQLTEKGENFGYFNAKLDQDGTIRQTQLVMRSGSRYMPSIALQAFLAATKQHVEVTIAPNPKDPGHKGVSEMAVTNEDGEHVFNIPVNNDGTMLINYAGRQHTIPHASIADLLDDANPDILVRQNRFNPKTDKWEDDPEGKKIPKKDFFKDKILVIGATAIGVFDLRVTPFDENYPGVETHANVIDNLLRRDFLRHNSSEEMIMPVFMFILGLLQIFALSYFGALAGLVCNICTIIGIGLFDKIFLFSKGTLVSIELPLMQMVFTYGFLTFYKYFTEERSKKELRATFSKYVSPAIVNEILKDPKNLELGGRKERVTVFFSDVRGFTTISEKLDPRALSDLLNSYLTPMTELVFKNQGTLDKYMGDAIMAFFGAPVHYKDHAKMACRCALQNLEKLKELQAEYKRKGLPNIDVGIGLNTGECSVGNMGSETVRSYTVMGDSVNLASRLEGINKTYGTHIIVSEFTFAEVKDDFLCREVDWVRVKGKLQPVKIFELLGEKAPGAQIIEMAKYFGEGYQMYHQKQFDNAIRLFNQALGQNPADETSKIYIERCQEFVDEPPPPDWDGVYVMKTK